MDFVSKKDFEKAILTLELALKNGQVRFGRYDDEKSEEMTGLYFGVGMDGDRISANHAHFISPVEAAKDRLASVRNSLTKHRQEHVEKSKTLSDLENLEKQLVNDLTLLKESKE